VSAGRDGHSTDVDSSGAARGAVSVLTVDGPSGAGKGTLAVRLSGALGFGLLDSGALYRLTALKALRHDIALDDAAAVARLALALNVSFRLGDGDPPVLATLDGENVDQELRSERCGDAASRVAAHAAVRDALLARQHAFRSAPGLVADGRDMGTVVFPDARLKLFLTASAQERAHRRYKQLIAKGISASLYGLCEEIKERDRRDTERLIAPLKPAEDAVIIETSDVPLDVVFERAMKLVCERFSYKA
jgi:cytidylate kinase